MKHLPLPSFVLLFASIVACSGSDGDDGPPLDFTGKYQMALRAGPNECGFDNWTEGSTADGIPMNVTQTGSELSGDVEGATRIYLDLVLGGHVYKGTATGKSAAMSIQGTRAGSKGNCAYTIVSALDGSLSGDTLSGTITVYHQTNNGSDCGTLATCKNRWTFNGVRPPSP